MEKTSTAMGLGHGHGLGEGHHGLGKLEKAKDMFSTMPVTTTNTTTAASGV